MDISLNPESASNSALVEKIKELGNRIRFDRRRFIALLPEIDRRELWRCLHYDDTSHLARSEAELSASVVEKLLKMAKQIHSFPAIRRLFQQSDIGWTKFAVVAPILNEENAEDFLWHLKNSSKRTLELMVRAIKENKLASDNANLATAKRSHAQSTKHRDSFSTQASLFNNQPKSVHQGQKERSEAALSKDEEIFCNDECTSNSEECTSSNDECNYKTDGPQGTNNPKTTGKMYYIAGKPVVNLAVYAHVAEELMRLVDKLDGENSRLRGLSTVLENLLFEKDDKNGRRKKPEIRVVTFDEEKNAYSTRSRYGDYEVKKEVLKENKANYEAPLRLEEIHKEAIVNANDYMLKRFKANKKLTRYVPAKVKWFIELRSRGGYCEFPGCNCRGYDYHHLGKSKHKFSCHPDNLLFLCKAHHTLAHDGALKGEGGPINELTIDPSLARKRSARGDKRAKVDELNRYYRNKATKERHQPKLVMTGNEKQRL